MPITEEEQELRDAQQRGSLVQSVVNSAGWKEVIRPALDNRRMAIEEGYKTAKTLENFSQAQWGIAAIDFIIGFIEVTLVTGKEATDDLNQTRAE